MRVEIPFHVLDKYGKPINGATVTVYRRWTTASDGSVNAYPSNATAAPTYANPTTSTANQSLTTDSLGRINAWVDEGQYAVVVSGNNIADSVTYFEAGAANVSSKEGLPEERKFTRAGVTISTKGIEVDNQPVLSFRSDNSVSFQTIPSANQYETRFGVSFDPSSFVYSSGTSNKGFLKVVSGGDELFNVVDGTYYSSLAADSGTGDGRLMVAVNGIPNLASEGAGTSNKIINLRYDWSSLSNHDKTASYTSTSDPVLYLGRYWRPNASVGSQKKVDGASASGTTWTFTTNAAHGFVLGDVVTVYGITGVTDYNNTFTITEVTNTTTFKVTGPTSNPSGTGVYTNAYAYEQPSLSPKWDQVFPLTGGNTTFYSKATSGASSNVNTLTLPNVTNLANGMYVYGTGIPFGTRIDHTGSLSSPLTLNQNVNVASGATVYFGPMPYVVDFALATSIYGYKNKVLRADSLTAANAADVLKNLIEDLKRYGLIS